MRRPIIGGTEAPPGAYPETVAIMDLASGDPATYFCSGTLIAPDVVLSAAHCLFDWDGNRLRDEDVGVFVGNDAQSVPIADVVPVRASFVPSTYPLGEMVDWTIGYGRDDDISLLVLARPIANVEPAPILDPSLVGSLTTGTMLLLVGFGTTTLDWTGPDGVKFYASSPVQVHSEWEIVIGAPGQPDTCYGDSGGPAFLESGGTRLLVGVTSRGTLNSTVDCGEGTINTLAPAYLSWIEESLASIDGGLPSPDASQQDSTAADTGGAEGGWPSDGGADAAVVQPDASLDGGTSHDSGGCGGCSAMSPTGHRGSSFAMLLVGLGVLARSRRRFLSRRGCPRSNTPPYPFTP